MSNPRVIGGLSLALSVSVLAACGGSSSPAQPTPAVPIASPSAQPTPKPLALTTIPPCPLPASNPGASASCTKPQRRLEADVNAAIGETGLCGKVDAEGEIGIKMSNAYNEQWIIASKAGYNPPVGNWVQRKYVGACSPSTF